MAKRADLRAAKERKQKKIAAVGGVLLVIVLFVQVPRTLKMMDGGGEEPVAAAPATPAATTPAAAPGSPAPAAEPETVVTASLVSFSRFESKDPFVQQVEDEQSPSGGTPAGASGGDEPDGAISGPESGDGAAPAQPGAKTQAEIDVNGVLEAVSVDTPFPAANPMFLLVSVAAKSASIKVADGGTFASGAPTLKLALGKPVTLVNTADGTRFVLLLKRVP
jgi:hypothetical protein